MSVRNDLNTAFLRKVPLIILHRPMRKQLSSIRGTERLLKNFAQTYDGVAMITVRDVWIKRA